MKPASWPKWRMILPIWSAYDMQWNTDAQACRLIGY
jgi:hypothetical protein